MRIGTSKLCVGDDAAGPTAGTNTCLPYSIFDGGFHNLSTLKGRYMYFYRVGDSIVGDGVYNLSKIRIYLTPNLINSGTIFITNWANSGGPVDLLKTNLSSRTSRGSGFPLLNASGTNSPTGSCFRLSVTGSNAILSPNGFLMGIDHGREYF